MAPHKRIYYGGSLYTQPYLLHTLFLQITLVFIVCSLQSSLVHAASRASCSSLDRIDLSTHWTMQSQFAGFLAASQNGYYDQECLDVVIRVGGPGIDPLQSIKHGTGQFAVVWLGAMVSARASGVPIMNVFQHFSRSGLLGFTRKASGIDTFAKLKGKNIGYWNGFQYTLVATLRKNNINETKDVVMREQSYSALPLVDQPERFDFISGMIYNEFAQLLAYKKAGTQSFWKQEEFNIFDYNHEGTSLLEDGVVVNTDWLNQDYNRNMDITIKFLKASIKGWIYCRDNEADCINILPDKGAHQQWQMREINRLVWPTHPTGLGIINETMAQRSIDILVEHNIITYADAVNSYTSQYAQEAIRQLVRDNEANPSDTTFSDYIGSGYQPPVLKFCLDQQTQKPYICTGKEGAKIRVVKIILSLILPVSFIVLLLIFLGLFGTLLVIRSRNQKILAYAPLGGSCVILFTDVYESTKLWNKDPDAMRDALQQHNDLLRELLNKYEGFECKTQGDSFMCAFREPVNALKWMLAVQLELLQVNWSKQILSFPESKFEVDSNGNMIYRGLRIRMGGHYGNPDVQFDRVTHRYDYYGNDVNLSSRVSSAAWPGQILISGEFYKSVKKHLNEIQPDGSPVIIKKLGKFELKGIGGYHRLIEVLPQSLSTRVFEPPKATSLTPDFGHPENVELPTTIQHEDNDYVKAPEPPVTMYLSGSENMLNSNGEAV